MRKAGNSLMSENEVPSRLRDAYSRVFVPAKSVLQKVANSSLVTLVRSVIVQASWCILSFYVDYQREKRMLTERSFARSSIALGT
jgi:hypothetical protein